MKKLLLLLFPLTLFSQPVYQTANYMGDFGDYHYYVSKGIFTFWEAQSHVRTIDPSFRVASIHSEDENTFVYTQASTVLNSYTPLWLGGNDTLVEGQFVWDDGTPFNYNNWAPGEPNNSYQSGEHYIMMNYPVVGLWNDATNTGGDIFHYIFKVRKSPTIDDGVYVDDFTPQVTPQVTAQVTPQVDIYPTLLNRDITDYINVDIPDSLWSKECKVWLNDGGGKMILFNEFVSVENNKVHLPLMANGLYHGVLMIEKEVYRFKVVVVR